MTGLHRLAFSGPVPRSLALTAVRLFRSPAWQWVVLRILLIAVVPIFVALYHDIGRHYLWLPDWDIMMVAMSPVSAYETEIRIPRIVF